MPGFKKDCIFLRLDIQQIESGCKPGFFGLEENCSSATYENTYIATSNIKFANKSSLRTSRERLIKLIKKLKYCHPNTIKALLSWSKNSIK